MLPNQQFIKLYFTNSQHTQEKTQGGTVFPNLTLEIFLKDVKFAGFQDHSAFTFSSSFKPSVISEVGTTCEVRKRSWAKSCSTFKFLGAKFAQFQLCFFSSKTLEHVGDAYQNLRFL